MKKIIFTLALLISCSFFINFSKSADAQKPNVLFIAVDDLKPLLNCYGYDKIQSPNIDKLAATGTVFLNNHCQQAVCAPSRASLLTGMRPDTTKVWDLQTKIRDMNPDIVTLPQHFKNNGYKSIGMGKIFDPRSCDSRRQMDEASWSEPYNQIDGSRYVIGNDYQDRAHKDRLPTEMADLPDEAFVDGKIANQALKALDKFAADQNQPFFLAVGFKKPHLPFTAPKKCWDLYDRDQIIPNANQSPVEGATELAYQDSWELRSNYGGVPGKGVPIPPEMQKELIHGYRACVSHVDNQVGKIMTKLHELGLDKNTIVVLWGDHGFHLGDHGMFCKHTNYEQATRSPLIFSVPEELGSFVKGAKTDSPTEFVDIFPTLCELTGIEVPANLEGASLTPILKDASVSIKKAAISQYPRGPNKKQNRMGYSFRTKQYRYTKWLNIKFNEGERDGEVVAEELYDYQKDPEEIKNLLDDPEYVEVLAKFREMTKANGASWKSLVSSEDF